MFVAFANHAASCNKLMKNLHVKLKRIAMKRIVSTLVFSLAILGNAVIAKPIEIDTPDAHIIVMRALDSWSGDESASEESLSNVKNHHAGFRLTSPKGPSYDVLGYPLLFGLNGDAEANAVVQGVIAALNPLKFKLTQSAVNFTVDKAIALEPTNVETFAKYEHDLYIHLVTTEGNPKNLHSSVFARKFFANVLTLGVVVAGSEKYGSLGSQAVINSGIPNDIYNFTSTSRAALTPLDFAGFEAGSYKAIDVRRVIQGNNERAGQVIIAYKNDKTETIENEALIKAIVTLTGADTTPEAIQQARDEDYAKRQAIWDACVTDGKCKND
jgi:hypothetical protein